MTQIGDSAFPGHAVVGDEPAGYQLQDNSLDEPLEPDVEYIVSFSRGEAYEEHLVFIPSQLTENVLTFNRQELTPEAFGSQGCDGEG